jgi:hypothetical protein
MISLQSSLFQMPLSLIILLRAGLYFYRLLFEEG